MKIHVLMDFKIQWIAGSVIVLLDGLVLVVMLNALCMEPSSMGLALVMWDGEEWCVTFQDVQVILDLIAVVMENATVLHMSAFAMVVGQVMDARFQIAQGILIALIEAIVM